MNGANNRALFHGDNLAALRGMDSETVDLPTRRSTRAATPRPPSSLPTRSCGRRAVARRLGMRPLRSACGRRGLRRAQKDERHMRAGRRSAA